MGNLRENPGALLCVVGARPNYMKMAPLLRAFRAEARNVDELHSEKNNVTKETALDERGRPVNGRTEQPNKHDILTGSRPDGTAFPGGVGGGQPFADMTCGNWTKSTTEGAAMTGHHDRAGPIASPWATSWNSSHPTVGCSMERIRPTGGDGLFYCFAAN